MQDSTVLNHSLQLKQLSNMPTGCMAKIAVKRTPEEGRTRRKRERGRCADIPCGPSGHAYNSKAHNAIQEEEEEREEHETGKQVRQTDISTPWLYITRKIKDDQERQKLLQTCYV